MYTISTSRSNSLSGPSPRLLSVGDDGDSLRRSGVQIEGHLRQLGVIDTGEATVMCCQYYRNGAVLAVGLSDGLVKIYDPESMTLLFTLSDPETQSKHLAVTSMRFLPSHADAQGRNILLTTYASGVVKIWHFSSQKSLFTVVEDRTTLCCTFNPEATKFLTSGSDSVIQIYDVETRKILRSCERSDGRDKMNGHSWRIFALKYHEAQPRIFLTGGWDNTVQFWDDREKHSTRKIFGPHICGDALDIDPINDHILTGSWTKDTPLQVWDFGSGAKVSDVIMDPSHPSLLYCAQWHGRDYMVCGGCDQNIARIVDRGTLNIVGQVANLDKGVYCVDNSKQGTNPKFAIGAGSSVYLLQLARM